MTCFKILIMTIISFLLFACSDISDKADELIDTNDDDDPQTSILLSGKVADGYLSGAKVCLDLNNNKACDENEPVTFSTAGGVFTFDDVTQAQIDSAPLLVEIIEGETIDEDNPGVFIDKKYTLTAPVGYTFVSPLTTMVQSEIEDTGISREEAEGSVQAKLGTTLDLGADYVAGSISGANSDEFERLHKVARVTTVVLQTNIALVEDVLTETETSFEDLLGLVVSQVLEALNTITEQVEAVGENFDPTVIAESDNIDDANVNAATLEDDIAEREAAREIADANIAEVLGGEESLHFFEAHHRDQNTIEFSYGTVTKTGENTINILHTRYDQGTNSWVAAEDEDDRHSICVLDNNSWHCVDENMETMTIEGNTVVVKTGGLDATRTEITGVSVDLAGKNIKPFLNNPEFSLVIDPTSHFSAGTTGYKLSFKRTTPMHALYKENVAAATDCWQGGDNDHVIQVGQPFNPTDTWCNNVFIRTGDGNHMTDGMAATTLNDLISATPAVNPRYIEDIKGAPIFNRDFELMAEFVEGGIVNYYRVHYGHNGPAAVGDKISANWQLITMEEQSLLTFTIPDVFAEHGDIRREERAQFFAVHEGYVRNGHIEPADEHSDNEWVFNNAARDQILTAFDYSLLANFSICSAENVDFDPKNAALGSGASAAEFVNAATNCNSVAFSAEEVIGTTLATDFGFLKFKAAGIGVFLGEVANDDHAVLVFTWSVNANGHIVVNAQASRDNITEHLRLTLAKIEKNTRQISLLIFSQEAPSENELSTIKGSIFGNIWGVY